jgi:hypothetical protein
MRKITIIIATLYLLGSFIEFYKYMIGSSVFLFKDYPIAIVVCFFIGSVYLTASFKLNEQLAFKTLAIIAGLLSIVSSMVLSLYNSYIAFGNSFDFIAYSMLPLLTTNALFTWYIWRVIKYEKNS